MRLSELLKLYLASHPMAPDSAKLVWRSIHRCIEFRATWMSNSITELDVVRVRQVIDAQAPLSHITVCKWLKILIEEAWEATNRPGSSRVWPKFRHQRSIPDSWSEDEAARLLTVASVMPGQLCGIPAGLWFRRLLVAWDTALRASQMFRLTWDDISGDGKSLLVRPQPCTKSYRPIVKFLRTNHALLC